MGAYFTFYFSGSFLGPIMSGNLGARTHGWRDFFWLGTGLSAFVTILLVFFFPETKWRRDSVNHAGPKESKTETKVVEQQVGSENSSEHGAGGAVVNQGRPSKAQFSPIQKIDPNWWKYIVRDITTPVIVFFNPIVFSLSSR